jgi:DNA-binding NtrC family response regulator
MAGVKVLLVDDEVEFTHSLSKVLRRRGFEVEVAGDGLSALVKIHEQPFEVVVLDIKMPGMDGMQVLSEIKRLAIHTQVILLTGHLSITEEEDSLRAGAFAHIFKPYPVLKLVELIETAGRKGKE